EIVPTMDEFIECLPRLIYHMDEPMAGPGLFPQYIVNRYASQHVKVVLGGQGGDEFFGGYARYLVAYLEQALKGAIFETQEEGRYLVTLDSIIPNLPILKQYVPMLKKFWSEGLFESMDRRYFRIIDRTPDLESLLSKDFQAIVSKQDVFDAFQKQFNDPNTKSYINKMTHFDLKTLLPALLHVEDRVSMAVSLESRVPILDPRIAELAASVPPRIKFQGGKTKALLKKAMENVLPPEILNRKDKMGFPVPLSEWMDIPRFREFVHETLLSRRCIERGFFREQALYNMVAEEPQFGRQLWGLLCLELWFRQFIDRN
ncbi:MAG: asparagine synthetase B family protein, partial [Nitrospinaceae bacterium]